MAGWKDFREIVAWQRARELKLRVDELLERHGYPINFKYRDQLSDAARSAPRNIAEGRRISDNLGSAQALTNNLQPQRPQLSRVNSLRKASRL